MESLSEEMIRSLIMRAGDVAQRAYAPYSRFPVGACLLTGSGRIFEGCNVENASYGLTVCAERAALFAAVGAGCRSFRALVLYTPTPEPVSPCGACRQVLIEFGDQLDVICACAGDSILRTTIAELLPHSFHLDNRVEPWLHEINEIIA